MAATPATGQPDASAEPRGRAEPFSPVVAVALGAVALAGFAAFLLFGAFGSDRARDTRGGSALSDAAVGFAGIVQLLRARGVEVAVSRSDKGDDRDGLFVLTPPPNGKAVPVRLLDDGDARVLVVLPKWRVRPLAGHPGWVESEGVLATGSVDKLLPRKTAVRRAAAGDAGGGHGPPPRHALHGGTGLMEAETALPLGAVDPLQTVGASADWTPVLLDEGGGPVLLRRTGRDIYLLADPDVIDTRALATPEGARTALAVMDALRAGGPVTFDVTLNGFGAPPNLLRLLFEPPLLGATLCAAAAGLLVLLMALHRFGPPDRAERVHDFGKRALADNSAGLIALAGREPRMAAPYAALLRAQALAAVRAPPGLDAGAADRLLDAASRARGLDEGWTALAAAAATVRGRADLLAVAERLHRWRKGMGA